MKMLQGYTLLWRESVLASELAKLPVSHNFGGCKRERCRVSVASYLRQWLPMAQIVNLHVIYAGNLHFTKLSRLWATHDTVSVKTPVCSTVPTLLFVYIRDFKQMWRTSDGSCLTATCRTGVESYVHVYHGFKRSCLFKFGLITLTWMKTRFIYFYFLGRSQLCKFNKEMWRNMARATKLHKNHSFQPPQTEAVAAGRQWDVPLLHHQSRNQSLSHSSQGKQLFGPPK